ncbi:MAG: TIGR03086 family protein [Ilumatobacteraceae bacterium]|nr:TIGR03086 family protein [Ilumatobacteraceae bacterium]
MSNPVDLLRNAVADAAPNYAKATVEDLDRDTPCGGWDLRALLNHTYSIFALSTRAARLEPTEDFAVVEGDHVGNDPAGAYSRLTSEMLAAWDACEDLDTPRVTPMGSLPPGDILLAGAQDVFIHAWDVAKTIGTEPELSPNMIAVFTETHQQSIDEAARAMFFDQPITVPDDASPLDKLVAFLGREP